MKTLIGSLPLFLQALAITVGAASAGLGLPGLALAVPVYVLSIVLLVGLAARYGLTMVRPGRFDRDPGTRLYRGRMVYGAAWTTLYYCKPLLHVILSLPPLKRLVFRAFGYRGSMDFTIYPDSWIRDLALLDFGAGTYIANRVTLGTNVVRSDGRIEVAPIQTGARALIGHLAMIGGGSVIGAGSEVGVATKIGFKVRLGEGVSVGPDTVVDSGTRVQDGVVIGARAYIGKRSVIYPGLRIPAGAVIPDRSVLRSQQDLVRVLGVAALAS